MEKCADCVYAALADTLALNGRVQVEDLISAAAAIVGEAAIAAAGEFDPRRHSYTPGTRIFSTNINGLICGDRSYEDAPANSIIGILRDKLSGSGFTPADFPALRNVFEYFATHSGRREDWGESPFVGAAPALSVGDAASNCLRDPGKGRQMRRSARQ